MTTDQNGAWLELQEVHSSLNYLKEKLNKTGQKISAAASQSSIEFNFTGLPSSLDSGPECARTFRAAATSTTSLASLRRYQHNPRSPGKQGARNGLFPTEPLSRERSHACADPPFVSHGALLQRNELNFVRSLRQPDARGNFMPSAAAITTAGNVTFTVGGVVTEHSASTNNHHVKKACYINDETHKVLKQPRHSGCKSFLGSSDRLHRLVERQKRAAGRRNGKTKSPQHQTDRNANHIKASTSPVGAGGHSPRLVDAATFCKPRSATVGTNTPIILDRKPSELFETTAVERGKDVSRVALPSEQFETAVERGKDISRVALPEATVNASVPLQHSVDEYLEYLKRRTAGEETGVKEQWLSTSAGGLDQGLERDDLLFGSDWLCTDWEHEMSVDLVWKRKFASVREPKEYKGFSLKGDPLPTPQKARKLWKADGPEDAPRVASAPSETTHSGVENTEEPQPACPKPAEKGSSSVHPAKPAAITTTSWKEGRDLALKKRGPYPADTAAKLTLPSPSGKQLKGRPTTDQAVLPTAAGISGDRHIVSCAARVEALRNLKRSQSVKRKAQNATEPEEGSPAPATKVHHGNAPAVREFMVKQRLGRKMQKDNVEQGAAEAARVRQQRLEKLYAFQRKTARSSARNGREKVRRQQEDEEFVHQFVEHLKSMQDVVDGRHGQDGSSRAFFPGHDASAAGGVDCVNPVQLRSQSCRDQEVQVGAAQVSSVASGKDSPAKGSSMDTSSHSSSVSKRLHHLRRDSSRDASDLGSAEVDLLTSNLVGGEAPPEPEFHYEPTEQVIGLAKLTAALNQTLDEQLRLLGCNVSSQVPSPGECQAADVTERLHQVVTTFGSARSPQPDDHGSSFQRVPREQSLETAEKVPAPPWEQHEAARMMQHSIHEYLAHNVEGTAETNDHEAGLFGGVHALSCIPEESTIPQTDSSPKPSTTASGASLPGEEPSHHLMPSPNTIAAAWKKKSIKTCLTSTQLDDECSLPSFSLSTVPPTGSPSPKKALRRRTLSAGLQEEEEATPEGTSAEAGTSVLEKDSERDSTLATGSKRAPVASRTETDSKRRQPEAAVGRAANSGPATWPLQRRDEAVTRVVDQGSGRRRKHEGTEMSLLPASSTGSSIGASRAVSKPEPRLASLDNDRAWALLEAQAKALQASAETARQLAQVRAPSLLELHGEDMVQRLTANTVVAASALAAALASQRPDWQVPGEKDIQRRVDASSSSSTTSQPTDAGFESNDKTSPQSSTEESCSLPADSGRRAQEGQRVSQPATSRTSADGSEKSNSSASISEELDTLGFSDSSLDKRKLKASTSKKRQPKNVLPLSLDSSATEDSTGVGQKAHGWSQSSLSDPILLDRDLLSYGSLPERPLGPSGTEEGGDQRPLALLRLQERDLIERARADFTWIEVLKRNCRENGSEDLLPGLRKRQRGILIRLHQKRAELKALQSCCVAQAREPDGGLPSVASSATSVPTLVEPELPDGGVSATGGHSSGPSEHLEASVVSDLTSDQSKESSRPEEISSKVEQRSSLPNSYVSSFESSTSFFELQEDSTHLKLNASKRFLEERQQKLQSRRKQVQELLEWQKKLNAEEANVRALERRALTRLRVRGAKTPQGKSESSATATVSSQAETSRSKGEPKSTTHPEDASFIEEVPEEVSEDVSEEVSEEVDAEVTAVTESVHEEEARTENDSGDREESTIESKVGATAASEAEVSTQTEAIIRSSSGSSSRKGLLLIKKPLVVRRKVRRDSSGSEDSFNVSLSETASDQSDIEGRILALSGELKKRQLEAEQLRREQRHRRTEVLREREQSLKKHIELYDQLIQQAKEELEKELDTAQHEKTVYAKPQIKKPRAAEQRKHRLVEPATAENNALHTKQSTPDKESPVETLTASSKSESKIVTEEEHSIEAPSIASSGAEESTAKGTASSVSDKNTEKSSSTKATETWTGSEVVEELPSKEDTVSGSSKSTVASSSSSKVVEEPCSKAIPASASPEAAEEPASGDTLSASAKATEDVPGMTASEPAPDAAAVAAVSTYGLELETVPVVCEDKVMSSGDDISEHISSAVLESVSPREDSREKADGEEQSARGPSQAAGGKSESQNDTTSEGVLSSLGDIEASLTHDSQNEFNQHLDKGLSGEEQLVEDPAGKEASEPAEGGSGSVNVGEEASSLADSYTLSSPGGPSSLEDESTAAEEVAEYTEEIVHSIVIDSSQSHEEVVEEGKVDRAVDSILRYLLEDTIKQFGSGRQRLGLPAEDSCLPPETFVQPVEGRQEEGSGDRLAVADISADVEQAGAPIREGATSFLERSTEDKPKDVVLEEDALLTSDTKVEPAEAQLSEEVSQQLGNKEIDSIADQLVSEAVDSVLAIAREKRLLATASVQSDDPVSNVSHKVSVILASIEERRNSREFQRPQDLMVLSTDLDDEDFSWKDSSAAPILTMSEDVPSETNAKELCSRAVQAEDCFLSTTTEQDWFDDDFGLGSGDNALAYQRRIPNKPPPPYSPPKEGFLSKLFSEGAWKVPSTKAEVSALVRNAATAIYAGAVQGTTFAEIAFSPEFAGERSGTFVMDADSHQAYCQFLFDLVKETAQELFCAEATEARPPPWQRNVRLRRKRPLPSTMDSFVSLVESKVMSVPGLHEDSELAFRNCGDRGLSFVDVLLYSEARSEEPDWVDYSREEVVVKDQVANAIFQLLVDDTLETLKSLWQVR
ncbi:uncharacterized protein LOC144146742 isoform X2 [Haemaphysalis longicornis]